MVGSWELLYTGITKTMQIPEVRKGRMLPSTSRQNKVRSKMETMRQVRFVSLNLIPTSCHLGENIKLDDRPGLRLVVSFVSC